MPLPTWTAAQWAAFGGVSGAGLCAIGLAAIVISIVRGWTADATYQPAAVAAPARPRPSIELAAQRRALPSPIRQPFYDLTGEVAQYDPARIDFTAPTMAMASAAAIAAVEPDPELLTSGERRAAEDAWINAHLADFAEVVPERLHSAALDAAMLTAVIWAIEGALAGVDAAAALAEWRIDTPTGEYAMIIPDADVRALAEAMLVAA